MPVDELTPYQIEVVSLLETGLGVLIFGMALLLCLVTVAVVRHL